MNSVTPVSLTAKQHKRKQSIDKGLAAILEVLNSRTATKVPLIRSTFSCAARIFEISQKVQVNKDEFAEFAEKGCRLVYNIFLKSADTQEIEPNLEANTEELLDTLQSIQAFGEKCAARSRVQAVLLSGFDLNEIKVQRWKLEQCMGLFQFQSLLDLREKTNQLITQHRKHGGVSNPTTNKDNVSENTISFGNNHIQEVSENKISFGNNHIQEIWLFFFILTLLVLMSFARE